MFDKKYIQENIEKIFNIELKNLEKENSFHYIEKGESSGTVLTRIRSPKMDLQLSPHETFSLIWDTYDTLKKLYVYIEKDSKSREIFIDILKEKLSKGRTVQNLSIGGSHDNSTLALYFLLKIGKNNDIIEIIGKRTQQFNQGLFEDLQIFMNCEPEYFDDYTLTKLKAFNALNSYWAGSFLREEFDTRIDEMRYNNLKEALTGVNEELNIHKEQVIEISSKLGFPPTLEKFLLEIDKTSSELPDWGSINSGMIGNLRNFFAELTKNIAKNINQITKKEYPKDPKKGEMGNLRDYIKNNLKLSDYDDKLIDAFIDILHNEGGHAFLSEKRYFLLTKNIGIEIAYFLLSKLEDLSEGKLLS
jgi:hypothetical protein